MSSTLVQQTSSVDAPHILDELVKIQAVIAGPPEVVAAGLQRYVEAGARHLVIRIGAPNLDEQLEQVGRVAALRLLVG